MLSLFMSFPVGWGGDGRALGREEVREKIAQVKNVQNTGMKTYWAKSNNSHSKSLICVSSFLSYFVGEATDLLHHGGKIAFSFFN